MYRLVVPYSMYLRVFHDAGLSGQGLTGTGRTILFQLAEITEVTLDEPQDVRFPVEGLVIDHLVRQLSRGAVTLECALADIEHTAQVVIVQKTLPVRQDGKRLLHVPAHSFSIRSSRSESRCIHPSKYSLSRNMAYSFGRFCAARNAPSAHGGFP